AMAGALRAFLPPEAAIANPVDLLADAREDRFGGALAAALDHGRDAFDAILMIHVVPFMVDAEAIVDALAARCRGAAVPVMHAMVGALERQPEWFAKMQASGVPTFKDAEEMCIAAGLLARHRALNAAR